MRSLIARTACSASTVALVMLSAGAARAEDDGGTKLEEIVVTAQKRSENLQDVPIAVTGLTATALRDRGVENVKDLNSAIPGLSYTTQASSASPRIRGVGTAIATAGNENAVATYVDGVYYGSSSGAVMSLNNIASISVLKGPQGTLFGRNATGGLIDITTRDPAKTFSGLARATVANHQTYGGDLYLGGGLADHLRADIAVHYWDQTDGFGKNLFNGKDANKTRDFSARSKWIFDLDDATSATLILDYAHTRAVLPSYRPVYGSLPVGGAPYTGGKFDINSNTQPDWNLKQSGASLKFQHDFDGFKLVSISAVRKTRWHAIFDGDSLPLDYIALDIHSPDDQVSEELQLVSTGSGPLKWVIGGYYYNGTGGFLPTTLGGPLLGIRQTIHTKQETHSYAAFGQATYAVTPDTNLTLGARYTDEKKSIDGSGSVMVVATGGVTRQGPYADSISVNKLTWRAALDHKLSEDVMGYISYNRGFKSGGYVPGSIGVARSFKPEVLDAFEVGLKSQSSDRRLRLNGAAFYYDYKDIQLNFVQSGINVIYNGKSATIYGLDVDAAVVPVDGLTLTGGLSLLHGRYGDFPITITGPKAGGGIVQLPDQSAKGRRLMNTPDWQLNLGATYRAPLAKGSLLFAGDFFHSDNWFGLPENRLGQKAYSKVNASVTWYVDQEERYSVRLWGKNLGNVAYASQLTTQNPLADFVSVADGRAFGVTVGAEF